MQSTYYPAHPGPFAWTPSGPPCPLLAPNARTVSSVPPGPSSSAAHSAPSTAALFQDVDVINEFTALGGSYLLITSQALPSMDTFLTRCTGSHVYRTDPARYTMLKFGSTGPVRVCYREVEARLVSCGLRRCSQQGQPAGTRQAVEELSRLVHCLVSNVKRTHALVGNVHVAIRLGTDTSSSEYSVLLGLSAASMEAASHAVALFNTDLKPLLC